MTFAHERRRRRGRLTLLGMRELLICSAVGLAGTLILQHQAPRVLMQPAMTCRVILVISLGPLIIPGWLESTLPKENKISVSCEFVHLLHEVSQRQQCELSVKPAKGTGTRGAALC